MKLSNRAIYGLRALFDLAYHGGGRPTQLREVAEREDIPVRFLEQIFQDLKRAELVESRRGPKGGYVLTRQPEEISLLETLEALEDAPEYAPLSDDDPSGADSAGPQAPSQDASTPSWRVTDEVCAELFDELRARFAQITLAEMAQRAEELGVPCECYERFVYVI